MNERQQIEQAIAALEAQRATLGDPVVDMALTPLHGRLAELQEQDRRSAPRLKYITVLFADIVDSTRMGQSLDPEDTLAVMDGALTRFAAIVGAHGGRVLRFMGDGLSAAFGADTSREDDPERAVRAGLALLADARVYANDLERTYRLPGFAIRVGINTGQVLLGGGVEADNNVMGTTINLARRMEESAPVGCLRVSHDTWRHVRGAFDATEEPPLAVKGSDTRLCTYLIVCQKAGASRDRMRGVEGIETPMVGREAELNQLKDAFATVCDERALAVVTVVGDEGLGKSRLLSEFLAWTESQARIGCLFHARANPESLGQPYGRMRELFSSRLQILDSDSGPIARQKFTAGVTPCLASEADAHVLGHLLGFDFSGSPHVSGILADARQIRGRGFHYAAQFFHRLASTSKSPVLLMLDDLHWADDGSLDFVNHLIAECGDVPLLIVGLARPALYERRPLWGSGQDVHARIDLMQLSRRDSRELAEALLKRLDEVPATLSELVTGGAEGNPFYMEELVKMLIDDGVIVTDAERWKVVAERFVTARVPATLTGVLQARLDALAIQERSALQLAAIVGYVFWEDALLALDADAPGALPSLMRRELVFARETSTFEGVREDVFKHHVLHQVTYDSVLKRIKREAHGKVAEWLAGQRGAPHLALIAEHYERAGKTASAIDYLHRAADDAATRYAHAAALDHVERALVLIGDTDAVRRFNLLSLRARVEHVDATRGTGDATLCALEQLAEQLGDDAKRAEAAALRGGYAERIGDFPRMLASARRALEKGATAAPAIAAKAHGQAAAALLRQSDYAGARVYAETGLALTRACGDRAAESGLLNTLGLIASDQGDASAQALYDEALALTRATGDRSTECGVLNNLAEVMRLQGRYAAARTRLIESLSLAREIGDRKNETGVRLNLALIEHKLGDHSSARIHADAALVLSRAVGERFWEAVALRNRGHAEWAQGDHFAAAATYAASRDLLYELGMPHMATESLAGLARTALTNGEATAALAHVESILAHLDGGGTLDGTDEPLLIRLTCYRVLDAAHDKRAGAVLDQAYDALQLQAARFLNEAERNVFLESVPANRDLVAAWNTHRRT